METWVTQLEALAAKAGQSQGKSSQWVFGTVIAVLGLILLVVMNRLQDSAAAAKAQLALEHQRALDAQEAALVKADEQTALEHRLQAEALQAKAAQDLASAQAQLDALAAQRKRIEDARNWKDLSNA